MTNPLPISGYVLAGGRSSRMGANKTLLQLAGKPLIQHVVAKIRRICADVHILGSDAPLEPYAPLVPDLHPGCGPIGGFEAALAHTTHDWNLFLPVDLPFLPTAFLADWVHKTLANTTSGTRFSLFSVDGIPQPTVLLMHHNAAPYLAQAVIRGDFKLIRAIESAARELAILQHQKLEEVLRITPWDPNSDVFPDITPSQFAARSLWFHNLNTPRDFALAEANTAALE